MSRLQDEVILERVARDAVDRDAAHTLVHLIGNMLPDDAGMYDIDRAVAQARETLSPLFWTPVPSHRRAGR